MSRSKEDERVGELHVFGVARRVDVAPVGDSRSAASREYGS